MEKTQSKYGCYERVLVGTYPEKKRKTTFEKEMFKGFHTGNILGKSPQNGCLEGVLSETYGTIHLRMDVLKEIHIDEGFPLPILIMSNPDIAKYVFFFAIY